MEKINSTWRERLHTLAEKHCEHDDSDLNSCLYHIFEGFVEEELEIQEKEIDRLSRDLRVIRSGGFKSQME